MSVTFFLDAGMLLAVAHGDDFKLDELGGVFFYFDIEVYSEIFSRTFLKGKLQE